MVNIFHYRFALAQATVEQGKFLLAGQELEKEEKLVEKQKAEWSAGAMGGQDDTNSEVRGIWTYKPQNEKTLQHSKKI